MFRVAGYRLLSFGLRVKALPDYFDLIFRHLGVGRHNRKPFQLGLSNEKSIEWVSMMVRKREDMKRMTHEDW